jgi:hypothetical protein
VLEHSLSTGQKEQRGMTERDMVWFDASTGPRPLSFWCGSSIAARAVAQRMSDWLWRYGPPELLGTLAMIVGAALTHKLSDSIAAAALVGNWAEALAFYGLIILRTLWASRPLSARVAWIGARNLVLEFGSAELLNGIVIRPIALYGAIALTPSFALGIVLGKVVADILFYLQTIACYELLRRRGLDHASTTR